MSNTLKSHYTITKYCEGTKLAGINFEWNHIKQTFRLSMNEYVQGILDCYRHVSPKKIQIYPHKKIDISHDSMFQYSTEADSSPPLNILVIKRVQGIVGVLLYYVRAIDTNPLVSLSTIGYQ